MGESELVSKLVLFPSRSLLLLEYSSLVTLIYSLFFWEGGGDLISSFWGDLGYPEGGSNLRYDLCSG